MKMHNDTVRIIPYEPETHWAFIYGWFHSCEYHEFFGNMPLMSGKDAMNFNHGGETFMIVDAKDINKIMGVFAVTNIRDRHRNCHLNVLVDKKFQGNDVARTAGALMINYIMNQMNIFKIIARVHANNAVSKHIVESFGFEQEGYLKQEFYFGGEFKDIIRYKITKGMFNKKKKSEKGPVGAKG